MVVVLLRLSAADSAVVHAIGYAEAKEILREIHERCEESPTSCRATVEMEEMCEARPLIRCAAFPSTRRPALASIVTVEKRTTPLPSNPARGEMARRATLWVLS